MLLLLTCELETPREQIQYIPLLEDDVVCAAGKEGLVVVIEPQLPRTHAHTSYTRATQSEECTRGSDVVASQVWAQYELWE